VLTAFYQQNSIVNANNTQYKYCKTN